LGCIVINPIVQQVHRQNTNKVQYIIREYLLIVTIVLFVSDVFYVVR
jgi:hypothetical protein